jgi:hypothetical protein
VSQFKLKAMPATPMTQEEMEQQCSIVSTAALAADHFSDDELEARTPAPAVAQQPGISYQR